MYKVSLIIPIFNVAGFIERSLLSALNQTYQDIEFILIDDCSIDESMLIVNRTIIQHPRKKDVFIYKHDVNFGQSAARNTGLLKAHGEYIFFMDSDDFITPDCIKLHFETIEQTGADFTVANYKTVGKKSIHSRPIRFHQKKEKEVIQSFLKREWGVNSWNKLLKKKLLIENSLVFKNDIQHEDILWSFQLALCAEKLNTVHEETYFYLIRKNSITTSYNSIKKIESLIFVIEQIAFSISKMNNSKDLRSIASSYITFLRFNTSLLLINNQDRLTIKRNLYSRINSKDLKKFDGKNLLSIFLKLPFSFFRIFFLIPYKIYKKI